MRTSADAPARHRAPRGRARHALTTVAAALAVATAASAAAPGWVPYEIKPGDSLWRLAHATGTTVEAIMGANGLTSDLIIAGELLYLPGSRSGVGGTDAGGTYLVRRGDTVSEIAERSGVSQAALARRNGLADDMKIYVGQRLHVPSQASPAAVPVGLPGSAVAHVQDLVRAEAARQGVDPALALAVASVESDFDQGAVSSAGAVGVMQLMPKTARWTGELVGRPLDRYDTADNVAGGVAFLRWLLDAVGEATAVAAYYQGLHSVQHDGLYSDTQRYVAKVLGRKADH